MRQIAKTKRKVTPKLSGNAYAAATKAAKVPPAFRKHARGIEGFLFPATYEFTPKTTAKKLVADQIAHFNDNWAKVDQGFAKTKNLTPYDVLIIASMVEKETIAPDERPKVAAVIYNRLKAGMPLGIDATIRYGLDVPGTEALRVSQLESDNPYNTRNRTGLPPTPIANPGPRLDAGRRAPGEGRLPLLRAQAGQDAPLLHGERVGVLRQGVRVRLRLRLSAVIGGTTGLVGLLRDPKVDSLSPRMQNAAFAALALDVAYVPLGVSPERLEDAIRGLVALGFLGANVTTPHKRGGRRAL